ncbi:thymidine phosphorylase family protein [archaeon]|jgi:AMP phosphorylase|nr:thymidine phosphorylase family protein [archaeon]MBT4373180.1 thymidine phosphorylase family protein [archaeon]MBT4531525.1 thymidine phosphorylase family protein [archaeon]MBT7001297.1 thymidine phosphorylase family protein [archaeon]MBT7282217.1 thymidine phosphorylase family protein [archaeon]
MELKTKLLKWSAGLPVAMLNETTANKIGVHAQERILLQTTSRPPKSLATIVDIVGDLVKKKEVLVSSELKTRLGLKIGQKVEVFLAPSPQSMIYIQKKLNKHTLNKKEIKSIISDVVNNSLSDAEISLFVSAMYEEGMSLKETIFLVEAILETGNKLKLKQNLIVDKHSIGGIPGNRTTPLVVAICATAGLIMPKTSSRAITSAAGTADVIETIARVDFSIDELEKIIKKTNACMVWGGALGLVPADSRIIHVEKLLKIDPESQLLASIMSKKLAVGSKYVLIDIPYGKGAKVDKQKALKLKRKFELLGKHFKIKIKVVLTKGFQPIGNGIGPALELKDILKILDPEQSGPRDLEDKSIFLAGQIFELVGKTKKGKGSAMAMDILDSGKAYEKFKEIIREQKGMLCEIPLAKYKKDIFVKKAGKITEINNKKIASLAKIAGCPTDKAAGLYLYSHVGAEVTKKQKLLTIYADSLPRLKEAIKFLKCSNPIKIV